MKQPIKIQSGTKLASVFQEMAERQQEFKKEVEAGKYSQPTPEQIKAILDEVNNNGQVFSTPRQLIEAGYKLGNTAALRKDQILRDISDRLAKEEQANRDLRAKLIWIERIVNNQNDTL